MRFPTAITTARAALAAMAIAAAAVSCDQIDGNPYSTREAETDLADTAKKVVLIEFTGHRCTNCPDGHRQAEQLKELYGERLIPVSIHAGFLANPTASYTADYRTEYGDALYRRMGEPSTPQGLVAVIDAAAIASLGQWPEQVEAERTVATALAIEIEPSAAGGKLTAKATVTNTQPGLPLGGLSLHALATEDSLVSRQLDNGTVIEDYVHRHVLRGAATSDLGQPFNLDPATASYTANLDFGAADGWHLPRTSVVVFVVDNATNKILQGAEVKAQ